MYSKDLIRTVWQKGRASRDHDAEQWRQDECGAWMQRAQYGDARAEFGWKIERVAPGAADDSDSLRPFHIANEYNVAAARPHCRVTADRTGLAGDAHTLQPRNRAA